MRSAGTSTCAWLFLIVLAWPFAETCVDQTARDIAAFMLKHVVVLWEHECSKASAVYRQILVDLFSLA